MQGAGYFGTQFWLDESFAGNPVMTAASKGKPSWFFFQALCAGKIELRQKIPNEDTKTNGSLTTPRKKVKTGNHHLGVSKPFEMNKKEKITISEIENKNTQIKTWASIGTCVNKGKSHLDTSEPPALLFGTKIFFKILGILESNTPLERLSGRIPPG